MRDTELLRGLLRVEDPWDVTESMLDLERSRVDVRLEWKGPGRCPSCGRECPKHDHRERTWRDLDLCGDQLFLHALVPRVDCAEHGVVTVAIPWSAGRSEFTERFERITIALIREMSVAAVSRRMAVSWDQVDAIMMRAVERGRTRQQPRLVRTSASTRRPSRRVIATLLWSPISMRASCFLLDMAASVRRSMPSGPGFRANNSQLSRALRWTCGNRIFDSTMAFVPDAASKIVFDRFHVTAYLTKAVDLTRRAMMRDRTLNRTALKGTKYSWLRAARTMDRSERRELADLRSEYRQLGRAWAIKESFTEFWRYRRESSARAFFAGWFNWATHSR